MRNLRGISGCTVVIAALVLTLQPVAARADSLFPRIINLPDDFQPEGIAIGRAASFFTGSLANGSIYRGGFAHRRRLYSGAAGVRPRNCRALRG